ncbi:uncharacterized protein LOC131577135 [Poecile atricapillus]|uniref:uncharacterized protein LOC131577135 n=1 Tax=Poecile atricapillus TaxID=48891 RepID=UPI0027382868|nr:uncharacterized protein LOC131577135 [Poecile atricapillus]
MATSPASGILVFACTVEGVDGCMCLTQDTKPACLLPFRVVPKAKATSEDCARESALTAGLAGGLELKNKLRLPAYVFAQAHHKGPLCSTGWALPTGLARRTSHITGTTQERQPAEARSYKLLSANCKALRDSSKHQEILVWGILPAFTVPAFWKPSVLQRHPRSLSTIRGQAVSAGRSSLAQPSARVSQPFARRLRIPEMTRHKHISCTCILEHFLQLGEVHNTLLWAYSSTSCHVSHMKTAIL